MDKEETTPKIKNVKKEIVKKNENLDLSIIQNIYEIRGEQVMLDFDLAKRYGVETRVLKQAVRRNIGRFEGDDFMFELSKNEIITLSTSQNVTLNRGRGSNIKHSPFAFTELGVAMLSSVLNSEKAITVNRDIMRAFVAIRNYVLNYAEFKQEFKQEIKEINARLDKHDMKFEAIFKLFDEFIKHKKELEKPRTQIGFKRSNENKLSNNK